MLSTLQVLNRFQLEVVGVAHRSLHWNYRFLQTFATGMHYKNLKVDLLGTVYSKPSTSSDPELRLLGVVWLLLYITKHTIVRHHSLIPELRVA